MHGEATFVEGLAVRSVLDAGCGTGRVAIELALRGLEVVGLDADPGMLSVARAKAPDLEWVLADLSDFELLEADGPPGGDAGAAGPSGERRHRFDAAVMAGNVMIFVVPGTEGAVVEHVAAHLRPGGRLVAGFQIIPGRLSLERYDELAAAAGLILAERYATLGRRRRLRRVGPPAGAVVPRGTGNCRMPHGRQVNLPSAGAPPEFGPPPFPGGTRTFPPTRASRSAG